MKARLILLLLGSLLTSCVALVVVGAAGGMVVYDNRSIPMIEKDGRIFHLIHTKIVRDQDFQTSRIVVSSFNRTVLLAGQVENSSLKAIAEKIAQQTPNVRRVYNQIEVGQKISIAEQSKDSWITGEVKTKMLAAKDLESGSIRVVTEKGVVYLLGIVTQEQANLAVSVARQIKGVRKVVKIFQYIR
ncbi:MAG: BON domain-containing protein [Legionellales bacterium RIFCSPHIGHO2_12_FULL_35_11]|nr:MAG: BON domain-containing protein [Legionellales bacterium RIFCSPHIGHO2_12_FULL_35_11]